jgi:hypothetical protein
MSVVFLILTSGPFCQCPRIYQHICQCGRWRTCVFVCVRVCAWLCVGVCKWGCVCKWECGYVYARFFSSFPACQRVQKVQAHMSLYTCLCLRVSLCLSLSSLSLTLSLSLSLSLRVLTLEAATDTIKGTHIYTHTYPHLY